ncbi:MAG: hypothetical protein AB1815_03405 [Bacillota bacterium]
MSRFVCDTCGEEISLHEGVLTWTRRYNQLSNFKLTHMNTPERQCRPENNRCKELYALAMVHEYIGFTQYLLERWENGFVLTDPESLERVMEQLNLHMHEKVIMLSESED